MQLIIIKIYPFDQISTGGLNEINMRDISLHISAVSDIMKVLKSVLNSKTVDQKKLWHFYRKTVSSKHFWNIHFPLFFFISSFKVLLNLFGENIIDLLFSYFWICLNKPTVFLPMISFFLFLQARSQQIIGTSNIYKLLFGEKKKKEKKKAKENFIIR